MALADSELILNADGSIYHLNLKPGQVAPTIITVGDPDRVSAVSKHFDVVEHRSSRREFHTHTGRLNGHAITVISTGIGTDNIDIVVNELDALFNVDFATREVKDSPTRLNIIRIGTSGAVQTDIPVDSLLISRRGIGFDSLLHWYDYKGCGGMDYAFAKAVKEQLKLPAEHSDPYVVSCDEGLAARFQTMDVLNGNTITNVGFYGPQSRSIRLAPAIHDLQKRIAEFAFEGHQLTNLEMETAGIYAMASLLGHKAVSLNAILANRATGQFSKDADKTVDKLIEFTLGQIVAS